MNWLPYVVPVAIGLLLLAATVLRRDLWPFSHYPMFAGYHAPAAVRFFRLQFTLPEGRVVALVHLEPELGDAFDREFARAWPDATGGRVSEEIVRRFWSDVVRRRPALRAATGASVMLRLTHLGGLRGVEMVETSIHVVDLTKAEG
jgi:hypothetical protein